MLVNFVTALTIAGGEGASSSGGLWSVSALVLRERGPVQEDDPRLRLQPINLLFVIFCQVFQQKIDCEYGRESSLKSMFLNTKLQSMHYYY